ncbi:conserved hypothetical protein [uncultured Dysgonomonas sp.]|uniref:Uncharacterized protein n=2 Tax=uncultured Dysgonomonas sp. TaxID=206096 RepID=A0A212JT05_9BACT|nr:conserved hypothetical protein [uncultured Dysgonomonas sp.]
MNYKYKDNQNMEVQVHKTVNNSLSTIISPYLCDSEKIMEKLVIKRQISYSCIFPDGCDKLEDILKTIPSRSAIAWASYMFTKKSMMTIDQREHDFFIPLLFQMNRKLQHTITNYLQPISSELDNYVFIDKVVLLTLIEYLLENHNESNVDVFESKDDFSNMFIAYLLCCDEKLRHTTKELLEIKDIDSQMAFHLPEQLRYNDIYYPKDYRVEFIKFYYFMVFCEENKIFNNYLNLFLQENQIAKWDNYLYFIFDTYCSMYTNEEGCTNKIKIEPSLYYGRKYLNSMCVDVKIFKRSTDFTHLRSKPIYYHGDNTYSIISPGFFVDKMFQSFLFDFASTLKNHKATTKINSYPELKSLVGNLFTENYLFYEVMNGCFSKTCKKLISGQELKTFLCDGEPDFYIRKGKNIFLFEFKDVMLNAEIKHCESLEQIKNEILQIFGTSTVEKSTGKQKKKPQAKGITQLLNVIEKKLDVIIQKADRVEITDKFNIYPIIVYQDCCFDIEGIRYMLNNRFEELKQMRFISEHYSVKQCVMIPLEMMIKLEDYFHDGRFQLDSLINDYIAECNQSEQNKLLPFNKFMMRQAWKLGYKNNMSSRFKKVSDFMIEKNKSK